MARYAENTTRIRFQKLCSECQEHEFPKGRDHGYFHVGEIRDAYMDRHFHGPYERVMAIAEGKIPYPFYWVQVDHISLDPKKVLELQCGEQGWVVEFPDDDDPCPACGDEMLFKIRYGYVRVEGSPMLPINTMGLRVAG